MDHVGHDLGPVLVTGASGYLGRRVVAVLAGAGIAYAETSRSSRAGEACDLTDASATRALLDRIGPSTVIHCAAAVPASPAAYDDHETAAASVEMTGTVARHARCPMVFASSMTVYGASPTCPADEGSPPEPDSAYARGKLAAEQLVIDRHAGDTVLRLPGLFGLPRRSGLLYNAAAAFLTGRNFEVAAPATVWAAMSVADAAECLVKAATTAAAADTRVSPVVNVGYHGEFSVGSAVAQIAALCGVAWHATFTPPSFSMRLDRWTSRYGKVPITFERRLAEFVDAVRYELALGAGLRP